MAGAVLLSLPMVPGILDGGIASSTALTRFLGALLLCWVGGAVVTGVIDRYADSARRQEIARTLTPGRQGTESTSIVDPIAPPDLPGGDHTAGDPPG